MPTDANILGFSNRWYKDGIKQAEIYQIDGIEIRYLSFPYFVATKLEAFNGRGKGDFFDSKDIEDIITVLAGRRDFLRELSEAPDPIKLIIVEQFAMLLEKEDFVSAVSAHFPRTENLSQKISSLIGDLKTLVEMG